MACEVGLYYVGCTSPSRGNKNAQAAPAPGLGECKRAWTPPLVLPRRRPPPQPAFPKSRCHLSQWARARSLPSP